MDLPVRILFTVPHLAPGGTEWFLISLLRHLNPEIFDPAVCVLDSGGRLEKEIEDLGVRVFQAPVYVPPGAGLRLPEFIFRAARKMRRYGFVLQHSLCYHDDWTEGAVARIAGVKAWLVRKADMRTPQGRFLWRYRLADRIVANSSAIRDAFFANGRFGGKTRVIHNGVDTRRFRPGQDIARWRERLQVPTGGLLLGFVGTLKPEKDHATLLRALAKTSEKPNGRIILALAGGGPLREPLERLAANLGITRQVRFLGDVEEVPEFLRSCDGFVLSSAREGFPNALLEAMSTGLACIATDCGGPRDVIQNGYNGWLVPPRDANALGAAIVQWAESPQRRAAFGLEARRTIEREFTVEQMVRKYEEVYLELLEEKGVRIPVHRGRSR